MSDLPIYYHLSKHRAGGLHRRAHAATKRNYTNLHTGLDMEQGRLMYATGDDDAITGGIGCPYLTDAEILGSVVSGDGTYMQAVKTRQAIRYMSPF